MAEEAKKEEAKKEETPAKEEKAQEKTSEKEKKGEKKPAKKAKGKPEEKAEEKTEAPVVKKKGKNKRRSVVEGNAYIKSTFNNTLVTITDTTGAVLAWATAGASGFRGTRKATPYAAQVAAEKAVEKAKLFGMERVHIYIQGVGSGREQAIRGLHSAGLNIESLTDTTPIPHNGCRKKKRRRV
jgi:small subunit ribosomal protein S11